jgi:hypothetical protein
MSIPAVHLIELKLADITQLFNPMDPFPFRERDLDRDAEEFIVDWAREAPRDATMTLRVHLQHWPAEDPTGLIRDALHNYFAARSRGTTLELRRLMRQGRFSLAIGLLFLAACLTAIRLLVPAESAWATYLRESLTIAGWVAMWRPMQIWLHDWWPIVARRRDYDRLARMPVDVVRDAPG